MARQLDRTLKSYLEDAGLLEPATLGADRRPQPAAEALEAPADAPPGRGHRQRRSQGALLWVLVTLLVTAFVAGVWTVLQSSGSPTRATAIGLPALFFLLSVTAQLRRIWSEKVTTDLLLDLIPITSPAEVPRLVETIFWQRHGRAAGSSPAGPFDPFIWPRPEGDPPRYDTFTIRILSDSGEEPRVLASSPAGEASGRLSLDADFRDRAAKRVEDTSGSRDVVVRARPPQTDFGALGRELFDAVFTGDVLALYDQCLGQLRTKPGHGLRLRLEIDPEDEDVAWLATLPWEALRRSSPPPPAFLGNRRLRTIVRSLDAVQPCEPLPVRLPLRILVLMSNPAGSPPLDLERERRLIEETWTQNPSVDVVFLERASLRGTMDRLHEGDGPFHVLHFMGHGGFDEQRGSVLYFETDDGRPDPVPGPLLAEELADHAGILRLVVVNACHSADARKAGIPAGVDLFAGIGTSLIRQGLTAVVAMQATIPDPAAVAFSDTLYRRLAAGDPVDTAVADGRRTLVRMEPDAFTWAIPVLFLRSGDGQLLALRTPAG